MLTKTKKIGFILLKYIFQYIIIIKEVAGKYKETPTIHGSISIKKPDYVAT